jgi:hypothetical protein
VQIYRRGASISGSDACGDTCHRRDGCAIYDGAAFDGLGKWLLDP